jgi:hypothetical protein
MHTHIAPANSCSISHSTMHIHARVGRLIAPFIFTERRKPKSRARLSPPPPPEDRVQGARAHRASTPRRIAACTRTHPDLARVQPRKKRKFRTNTPHRGAFWAHALPEPKEGAGARLRSAASVEAAPEPRRGRGLRRRRAGRAASATRPALRRRHTAASRALARSLVRFSLWCSIPRSAPAGILSLGSQRARLLSTLPHGGGRQGASTPSLGVAARLRRRRTPVRPTWLGKCLFRRGSFFFLEGMERFGLFPAAPPSPASNKLGRTPSDHPGVSRGRLVRYGGGDAALPSAGAVAREMIKIGGGRTQAQPRSSWRLLCTWVVYLLHLALY